MVCLQLNQAYHVLFLPLHVLACRYVESGDQTHILQAGYWPSYNIPFYEEIFRACGYSTAVEAYGTEFSYELCPRAKIFRRDQGTVNGYVDSLTTVNGRVKFKDIKLWSTPSYKQLSTCVCVQ